MSLLIKMRSDRHVKAFLGCFSDSIYQDHHYGRHNVRNVQADLLLANRFGPQLFLDASLIAIAGLSG